MTAALPDTRAPDPATLLPATAATAFADDGGAHVRAFGPLTLIRGGAEARVGLDGLVLPPTAPQEPS